MNLPIVIDVAISLIFIFLLLSLLASEIQELLTTILQWRASHLKESIGVLLAGGIGTKQDVKVQKLVEDLYNDPLIKNINQEAAKGFAALIRKIPQLLFQQKNTFGVRSTGPSYIPAETFATSLLERVGLATLAKKLIEARLTNFATRIIGIYDGTGDNTEIPDDNDPRLEKVWNQGRIRQIAKRANIKLRNKPEFKILTEEFDDILADFRTGESNLATSVERMSESLEAFINNYPLQDSNSQEAFDLSSSVVKPQQDNDTEIPENSDSETILEEEIPEPSPDDKQPEDLIYFARRLRTFKKGTFGEKSERAVKSGGLAPTFAEIAQLIDRGSGVYREVELAYKNIEDEGEEIEKEILPLLWEKLIDKNVEVVEQEIQSNLEFAKILEKQLKDRHPDRCKLFEKKLNNNEEKQEEANSKIGKRFHRKPNFEQRLTGKNWRSAILGLQRQRQIIIEKILDQLPDEERENLVKFTVAQIEQLPAGEKKKIHLIHNSLYRLTNEESQLLINDVLSDLADEQGWDEELTKQKRVLYGNYQTYKKIQRTLDKLPNSVKESFAILARRSQTQVQQIGQDVNQFREEVSVWFDRSMARTSGVYKRNIKGIAFLIGFLLAVIVNADTLFMFHRLTKDENMRQVVTQQAIKIAPESSDQKPPDLEKLRKDADTVLKKVTLPIGWNPDNFSQQLDCQGEPLKTVNWQQDFYHRCLKDLNTNNSQNLLLMVTTFLSKYWLAMLRIFFGWLLAAMAISMGAPFWFDLLGKVVNVRNAGSKPASSEDRSLVPSSDSKGVNTNAESGKSP